MTWNQLVTGVPQLCQDVKSYQNTLQQALKTNVTQDVRYIMLGAMKDDYVSALWIIAGVKMITRNEARIDEFKGIIQQNVDKETIQVTYTDYLRKSVITRVYFLLDHYLGSLSKHLTGKCENTVYKNAVAVANNQNLSASDIEVFSAMGYTRNSFHNNGIHQGKPQNYNIDGRQYNFTTGNQVSLSWHDISILIHAAIYTARNWGQSISNNILVPEK